MKKNKHYTIASGNVFEDLGFPDAQERLAKAQLALKIHILIKNKKLDDPQIEQLLNINRHQVNNLNIGKLTEFSEEELSSFVAELEKERRS